MGNNPYTGARLAAEPTIRTLVVSQHEVVRRQLVAYLSRSPYLTVQGEVFEPDVIERVRPDVLVLDLSQLDADSIRRATDAVIATGGGLIALASMPDVHVERLVREAGGEYRLKAAGADHLAEAVREMALLAKPLAAPVGVSGPLPSDGAGPI
jgi:DNA-binding NarL/FixJ family response regulator